MLQKNDKLKTKRMGAALCALLVAACFAINTPLSKLLLEQAAPTYMAAFLYLGAGLGVGLLYLFRIGKEPPAQWLTRADLPYTVAMIALDVAAPICLMLGIRMSSASSASLLGNFEIVATSWIASLFFREKISPRLWVAVGLITAASAALSFGGAESLRLSPGSLLVLLAACLWGLENNCTRKISGKSTYEIVCLKGLFSGGGSLLIALVKGEAFPSLSCLAAILLLGFVAYGLSIFLYVRAQRDLGAARTSAYYAVAPFIGTFLAFLVNGDRPGPLYFVGLALMTAGTAFVVHDTLRPRTP